MPFNIFTRSYWSSRRKKSAAKDEPVKTLHPGRNVVIRSPGRAGKNQNSSSFGGMGERELQLRLELLVEPMLSASQGVFEPAQALVDFSLADQERFLASVDKLSQTSPELAYYFCHQAVPSLKRIDEGDWDNWIDHLLMLNTSRGLNASIDCMQTLDAYIESITAAPSAVSFDEISRVLESIITGLNGRILKLEPGDDLYTDTETIHLPETISTFNERDKNFALYKLIAVHQWAQTWFGTWRADVENLTVNFEDKQRAIELFHCLETIRLDANIKRELPGIGRILAEFNSLHSAEDLPDAWMGAVKELSKTDATAHDSARLLYQLYDLDYMPDSTLYQGIINPALTRQTMEARIEEDRENLKNELAQLQKDINENPESPADNEPTESKRFEVREIEDDEMPDGVRYELELDGETVNPPENVQQLLESIQQDLGQIPEDYLEPEEEGIQPPGSGDENEEEINLRALDGEVFIYDEWDHSRQKYRKDWCHVREISVDGKPSDFVAHTLEKHRKILKHLHRTFEALREEDRRIHKQPYGEDIDLDALIASYADLVNGDEVNQNLFIKQRKIDRNIAVMFMIDMSASTAGWINEMEREALVLLCESLETLGDRYAIYGFSGLTHKRCDLYKIKDFEETYAAPVKNRIANIRPQDYTRMGAAIRHLSKLLSQVEAKTKILITLSDGRPDDRDGYRGIYGIEDTRRALMEAKFLGIHPFCITIDDEAMDYLQHMYGPVNFTIVDQVDKLPYKVSDIYRKITA
jgi:nitric oxide reductase NorD protein